jgi:polyisoprenyl-teichoic acid--peptidoglycan teichoic acid transferase
MREQRLKHNKKKKKWLTIIAIFIGVLLLGSGAFFYSVYNQVEKTVETMHEPLLNKEKRKIEFSKREPISILLMGVDERKGDRGRSDSLILITVNPNTKSMQMVSIPRDTRTEIVGKGIEDKINHAYAFGGTEMTIATVENFLDIPVDYYFKVNMEGFKDIVDAVGGVTVHNDRAFTYEGVTFPKGEITLDGEKALKYSRMRKQDPRGDFGRQDRQKQIIQAVIEKGASIQSLAKYDDVLFAIGENVKTNMTFDEMMDIQKHYKDTSHNLEQFHMNGTGKKINGIYYLIVPDKERKALSEKLKAHLEMGSTVSKK